VFIVWGFCLFEGYYLPLIITERGKPFALPVGVANVGFASRTHCKKSGCFFFLLLHIRKPFQL
jgi:hypothetical protein